MYKVIIKNDEIIGTPREDFISDSDLIAGLDGISVNDIQLVENEPFYNLKTGKFQLFDEKEYEEQKAKEERKCFDNLTLTAADVERAIYKVKDMDFDDIINMIKDDLSSDIDIKALKIELKANHFYRGNPYVNKIGELLGFSSEQLDEFFKTNDYQKLIHVENNLLMTHDDVNNEI